MWLRLDEHLPDNSKAQSLRPELFKFWINLLCICRSTAGSVPSHKDIAWRLRVSPTRVLKWLVELVSAGMLDRGNGDMAPFVIHDWHSWQYTSDNSTVRVKRFRERLQAVSRNVPEQSRADTEHKTPLPPFVVPIENFAALWAMWKKPGPRMLAEQYYSEVIAQGMSPNRVYEGLCVWAEWYTRTGGWRYCKQNLAEAIHDRTWETPAPQDPKQLESDTVTECYLPTYQPEAGRKWTEADEEEFQRSLKENPIKQGDK